MKRKVKENPIWPVGVKSLDEKNNVYLSASRLQQQSYKVVPKGQIIRSMCLQ